MSFVKSPITLEAGADLASKLLVALSAGTAIVNTAATTPIGVNDYSVESGEVAAVRTLSEDGTLEMMADGVIALGADVYGAAAGKISASASLIKVGIAMEAATADGDIIEVLPLGVEGGANTSTTVTIAAPAIIPGSVTLIDSGTQAVDATLADDTVIGRETYIVMTDASNSSTVSIASHVTSDPEVATFNAVDETLTLKWNGTEYETIHASATFV